MSTKHIVSLALPAVFLGACAVDAPPDFDGPNATTQSNGAGKSRQIVTCTGELPADFADTVAANGDKLLHAVPEAGFAAVLTGNADAYATGSCDVAADMLVQWTMPATSVAMSDETVGNPPFSGDDDFFFDYQWGHDAVNAPEAWNAGIRGGGVRVAVLDTGFDLGHPDLVPNINYDLSVDFTGEGLQYGPGLHCDIYVTEEECDAAVKADPDLDCEWDGAECVAGPFSPGTHTAGTIAAADNAFGTIGVAPEAELVLVKVLGDYGSGWFSDILNGIVYSALVDADVISMSIGALFLRSQDAGRGSLTVAMGHVCKFAQQRGAVVIASAGNDAVDMDHTWDSIHLPSDAPGVLSISATAPRGWVYDFSASLDYPASYTNYGKSAISFAAPGGDYSLLPTPGWHYDMVFSTGNGGWYWSAGTSMAAPHAAGIAALIISEGQNPTPAQVESAMRKRADDLGQPGKDAYYGLGRVSSGY